MSSRLSALALGLFLMGSALALAQAVPTTATVQVPDAGTAPAPSERQNPVSPACIKKCAQLRQCKTCFSHARPGGPPGAGTEEYDRCSKVCFDAVDECRRTCAESEAKRRPRPSR